MFVQQANVNAFQEEIKAFNSNPFSCFQPQSALNS